MLILAAAIAWADPAALPPVLRADVGLTYRGGQTWGELSEHGETVGMEKGSLHTLHFDGTFVAYRGLAGTIGFDATPAARQSWIDLPEMSFDPISRTGTYTGTESTGVVKQKYGGWDGVWIGAAVAPYQLANANVPLNLRIDVAFRTPGGRPAAVENGDRRGASAGGVAGELKAAFSTHRGPATPYFVATGRLEGRRTVDGDRIGAASFVSGTIGSDWTLWTGAHEQQFQLQMWSSIAVLGPSFHTSGDSLANTLPWMQGAPVFEAPHAEGRGYFGFDARFHKYVGMAFGVEGGIQAPHAVEHIYPVLREQAEILGSLRVYGRVR